MRTVQLWSCLLLLGCGSSANSWTSVDTVSDTHTVQLSQRCGALCLSDAGCPSSVAAGCFEAIDCNIGSSLHRHGAPDLGTSKECQP